MFVVTRGMARTMQIYGPFSDHRAAYAWAHKRWDGDGAYMIKELRAVLTDDDAAYERAAEDMARIADAREGFEE